MNKFLRLLLTGKWTPREEGVKKVLSTGELVYNSKVEEKEPDISEPVQTIIELFKANPRDFVLSPWYDKEILIDLNNSNLNPDYVVTHKSSGLTAEVSTSGRVVRTIDSYHMTTTYNIKLEDITLTYKESELLVDTFKTYYEDRANRVDELLGQRSDRQDIMARDRVTKLLRESK